MERDLLGEDRLTRAGRPAEDRHRTLRQPTFEQGIEVANSGPETGEPGRRATRHDTSPSVTAVTVDNSSWSAGLRISPVRFPSTVRNSTSTNRVASAS